MTATLSLYRLDAELTDLLAYRQERVEDRESPASAEELAACDTAIRQYMEQLPRKVDGVASFIRHCEGLIEEDDKEIARYKAHRAAVIENRDRVKDYAAAVLEQQPAPAKGCRKLVGQHSTIMLKGNGGVQPLVIAQPELVPDELCVWRGSLDNAALRVVVATLEEQPEWTPGATKGLLHGFTREPYPPLIREALLQPCIACDGLGEPGLGEHDRAHRCNECGGTGKNAVPGAHLEPRGQHVEVK